MSQPPATITQAFLQERARLSASPSIGSLAFRGTQDENLQG